MDHHYKVDRLRIVIMLRLFLVTFLLFLMQVVFKTEDLVFYYIIALVCVLSVFYLAWLVYARHLVLLIWFQIILDVVLESGLILYTNGVDSSLATIYVLSIITSGILIAPWSSFLIAGLCSILFSLIVALNHLHMIPSFLLVTGLVSYTRHDPVFLFYAVYVRITIFFVVAILTNYLTGTILKLEERIRIQKRLAFLGDITSTIAHEIRNPLAAISNSIEVLSHDLQGKLSDQNERLMAAVCNESERLKRVFNQILHYSKVDDLNLERSSISKLMDHVLLMSSHSKDLPGEVRIVKCYEGRDVQAEVDPEQIVDVFANIVRNARESMPGGGVLTVDIVEEAKRVKVSIRDTGVGMDKKTLGSLFLPFKTTKKTGTGLGLAQVQKIVAFHEGKIDIESKLGNGTTVEISLKKELLR